MKEIIFDNVEKRYGENVVIPQLNLKVEPGERLILLGPSGCGENSIMVTDTIIKLNQGLKASTKFLNKMILI